ncbi:hypothetical protein GOV09_04500 [Candidatus Woesearchaeota archaeon]|nr:hypothetical protein [Candidatus Woesearchaeota archaeon]
MDKEILKELGLTNNEIEVYLTLLKSGSVTVNIVAEKSGLHRQAVYDALDRLLEKGFVSFVIKSSKKHFQGIRPGKILDYIKEKEEKFRTLLPELVALSTMPREDTLVEVFKGKEIFQSLCRDILKVFSKKKGEVLISGVEERKFLEDERIALSQYLNKLRKLQCRERILIKEGDTHFVEGKQTSYKWISGEYFNPTPIYVYGDKLAIIIWGNPKYTIIIKNENLADSYRKQFNLLWKISKPVGKVYKKRGTS